jgi:hypothetical protein
MPVETMPLTIEQSDFLGGWAPDGENASTSPDVLLDVMNLLPDRNTGSLQARKGFKRLREELGDLTTHTVRSIHQYRSGSAAYLIVVTCLTSGAAAANNVRVYAITLSDLTVSRIDTAGVTWDNPLERHWGVTVDGKYYGGSKGNTMYSWDGTTWDADATSATRRAIVDDTDAGVDTTTEYARDFAWSGKELGTYNGGTFKPNKSIRYDAWESGEHYSKGAKVSLKGTWDTGVTYWKSFKCIKDHTADATNKPQLGTGSPGVYWEKVKLPLPQDEDSETRDSWSFVPTAAETSIATWHGERLFMRYDGHGDNSRVLYSKPVRPEKGEDVPGVTWDPTDFSPSDTIQGVGGGWLSFNDGKHTGAITALKSYGSYLIVFKRRAVWALSGLDDDTWTVRRIARGVGCVGPDAIAEHDGLVYFLSDDGLYVTDGTAAKPVPGTEKVQAWLRDRMDSALLQAATDKRYPDVWAYEGFIWFSIPDSSASTSDLKHVTMVYDPATESFWRTNLPVLCAKPFRVEGVTRLAFGAPSTYATARDLVYEYDHASAAYVDDDGAASYGTSSYTWLLQTAWWNFSTFRQDRRIRRVWAIVKGATTFTLAAYRNWETSVAETKDIAVTGTVATHIEGEWMADSHAISLKLSASTGGVANSVLGLAVDTEPRRTRYHA